MYILITLVSELLLKMIFNWQIEYSITWKIWKPTFKQLPADLGQFPARLHVDIPKR